MKTSFAVALAAFFATSAEGFTVNSDSVRTSTELNQYRPTKWTPQNGATGSATASVSSYSAPPSYTAAPSNSAPVEFGGMPKATTGPKGSYSVSKWSPQGGANPGFNGAPAAAAAAPAAAAPSGPSLDELARQWAAMNSDHDGVPPAPQMNFAPPAPKVAATPAAPAGPTMADLAKQWAAMNSSN
ncbi:hypothetical protein ACA910_020502 [Epithemia clementina (nom. ined.)]